MPQIVISTDGTRENFKLTVDGKEIPGLDSVSLSAYLDGNGCDNCCPAVYFSFSTREKTEDKAMTKTTNFRLDHAKASIVEEAGKPRPVRESFAQM